MSYNLFMKSVLETMEFDKVVQYLSKFAISSPARMLCLNLLPENDFEAIKYKTELTTEARYLYNLNLKLPIEHFEDMTSTILDAGKHLKLSGDEILDIANILRFSRLTKSFIEKNSENTPNLLEKVSHITVFKELEDKISETFDSERKIKKNASAELKRLYNSLEDIKANIKSTVVKLLATPDFTNELRDTVYTSRDGRTVFQVRAEAKNKIEGIVHDVSASGQTFFIEPKELTELHNRERETEILINSEVERILRVFSEEIGKNHKEIIETHNILAETDFIFAKAKYSHKFDSSPAELSDTPVMELIEMKNPVLSEVCDKVIPNDFSLSSKNKCTIITGSNTGGKTVILKTIGLFVLMARAGLHLPCMRAVIYPFKKVYADIGDSQNIIQSLSTFSSHIKNLIEMTNNADKDTLILVDEICSGTDPSEGAAIAKAILKSIVRKGACSVITTHYSDLKALGINEEGFENASVRFDFDTLKPTYKFTQGVSGCSNAITIAENLGLDKDIITEANRIYSDTTDKNTEKLSKMENLWDEAEKNSEKAREDAKEAENLKDKLNTQLEELKKEKKKIVQEFKRRNQKITDDFSGEIKEILKKLRENETRSNTMNAIRKSSLIRKKAQEQLEKEEELLQDEYQNINLDEIKSGDKVIIKNLNQEAEIISINGKKADVLMGSIKTTVSTDKLAVYNKKLIKSAPKKEQKKIELKKPEISYELDLRGYRYEEAMYEVEQYLDKACASGMPYVKIIHGHGTGVLKKAIRDYLGNSPYVAKFRAGESPEGGDGVSVVDLN